MRKQQQQLRVGDLVRHRPGGPIATVECSPAPDILDQQPWVMISWFTARGVHRQAAIAVASLERVEPEK